jgi:hypothetical protein
MKHASIPLFLICLICSVACSTLPDDRREQFGTAYRSWFSGQAVDEAAPLDPAPCASLPGHIATAIQEKRYLPEMTEKKAKEKTTAKSQLEEQ